MKPMVHLLLAAILLTAGTACGAKKKKEITSLERKQAETLVAEAQFAMSLRDLARAEGLMAKAAALCPDNVDYWLTLGATRVRLNQREGAKAAYRSALSACEDEAAADKSDPDPVLQQVTILALLGQVADARKLLEKLPARFPDKKAVREMVDAKSLETMLTDPKFKEVAL